MVNNLFYLYIARKLHGIEVENMMAIFWAVIPLMHWWKLCSVIPHRKKLYYK